MHCRPLTVTTRDLFTAPGIRAGGFLPELSVCMEAFLWFLPTYSPAKTQAQSRVVVQPLSCFWLLQPDELQCDRLPCLSLSSGVCPNSCPLCQWCYLNISSSAASFSFCLQPFPASGGQSIGVSASTSVLLMNIQGWFPLELTGLISLQSKGLSRVFSSTTVWKHQFFSTQPFTSIHDYWKRHSFDYMDLCWQSDVSAF